MGRSGSQRSRTRQQVMHVFRLCQHMITYFVLVSSVILPMLTSFTQGRTVLKAAAISQAQGAGEEEAGVMRSQIGSRPPRCAGRCYSCGHCEAIQVPTNPQAAEVANLGTGRAGVLSRVTGAYFRGDYGSNYKPMSWKCKCGNFILNP